MLKTVELEIELFCRGMVIDEDCFAQQAGRRISRTRAGLGSGLEIVIPGRPKAVWVNVPVVEEFAKRSPFRLMTGRKSFELHDMRNGDRYPVTIPEEPKWYSRVTSSDVEMRRIGVLQGNYLGIYISNRCMYWALSSACKFCTTGKNVGIEEELHKTVEDVIEVARAARAESGCIFTHLNTGYHFEESDKRAAIHGLQQCAPYVKALREHVGGFIGVQAIPLPKHRFDKYDEVIDLGADHFSFCYEFEDPDVFADMCPGKAATLGQQTFFDAMEYTAKKLGKGRVSGEIIAGIEPIEATKRGIDRIVNAGAFPTVCIFRPTIGSDLEHYPPPDPTEMMEVFSYMHDACRRAGMPIGVLPIEVSLVVQPEETKALTETSFDSLMYDIRNRTLRQLAKPYIGWKKIPRSELPQMFQRHA